MTDHAHRAAYLTAQAERSEGALAMALLTRARREQTAEAVAELERVVKAVGPLIQTAAIGNLIDSADPEAWGLAVVVNGWHRDFWFESEQDRDAFREAADEIIGRAS